jgi:hypothetical protein
VDWTGALTTIAGWGGLGAVIDFWIGRQGQQRLIGWMEPWWLKFSDIRLATFGREEANTAVAVLDRLFGARLFSRRRFIAVVTVQSVFVVIGIVILVVTGHWRDHTLPGEQPVNVRSGDWPLALVVFFFSLVSITVAISITRFAANRVAQHLGNGIIRNFVTLIVLLLLQSYLTINYLFADTLRAEDFRLRGYPEYPLVMVRYLMARYIFELMYKIIGSWLVAYSAEISVFQTFYIQNLISLESKHMTDIVPWASFYAAFLSNMVRLLLAVIFIVSYMLRPLQSGILALWARIIESEKPVFTLVFGGIAGLAKLVTEIIKRL